MRDAPLTFLLLIAGPASVAATLGAQRHDLAKALVARALAAQGGADALRHLDTVTLHGLSTVNALEQSTRPLGPYYEEYEDFSEIRRLDAPAMRREGKVRGYAGAWWARGCWMPRISLVVDGAALSLRGGALAPASQAGVATAEESLELGPERALLTASSAPDLRPAPPETIHGYAHEVVAFSWKNARVRIVLEPGSHMPAAVEMVRDRPLDIFWSAWGDVTTRVEWDAWTAEPGGVRYPRRWTTFANGQPLRSTMIDGVSFAHVGDDAFAAPAAVVRRARSAARPISTLLFSPDRQVIVAPGITLYPGPWNVVRVDQGAKTYLIEAPISGAYSTGVLATLARERRKIAGVVSTSDRWPHIAGIRAYVAADVPVITLDLNRDILLRLLASPHASSPDALATAPRRARITSVGQPIAIGSGRAAMRIVPLRTATGERLMLVYWPAHRLLYTSDLLSVEGDAVWLPQARDELASVIARERLDVETVFGMHYGPTRWARVAAMGTPQAPRDCDRQ